MIIGDSFTGGGFRAIAAAARRTRRLVCTIDHCGFDWKAIDRFRPDEVWWMPNERASDLRSGRRARSTSPGRGHAADGAERRRRPQPARARRRAVGKKRVRPKACGRRRGRAALPRHRARRATRRWRRGSPATRPTAAPAGRRWRSRWPCRGARRRGAARPGGSCRLPDAVDFEPHVRRPRRRGRNRPSRTGDLGARRAGRDRLQRGRARAWCPRRSSAGIFATRRVGPIARSPAPATRSCWSPRACRR